MNTMLSFLQVPALAVAEGLELAALAIVIKTFLEESKCDLVTFQL